MLAVALQTMHFQYFLSMHGPIPDEVMQAILHENPTPETMKVLEANDSYLAFMWKYSEFTEITLSGGHGATARFWMAYIKLVQLHLMFLRACKTNNLDLFIYALGEMRFIFFACSRPNLQGGW